jgi:NAD(P)-dependent dehydrogenase (short-subunit alcohol dehydrogenase family)
MDLEGRIAVVTGASRGLGRAFSEALVGAGARVVGVARSERDLAAVRHELGDAFTPIEADVTDATAVAHAFEQVEAAGGCEILVNNAGLGRFAPIDELSDSDWQVQMDTNLSGLFYCTREAVRQMKRRGAGADGLAGHIVHVASVAGLVGNPRLAAYNTTKFGVRGFAEATMKELREFGIRVTCLYPGSVATDFQGGAGVKGNPNAMQPEDVADTLIHVLRAPARTMISEVVLRPTRPA